MVFSASPFPILGYYVLVQRSRCIFKGHHTMNVYVLEQGTNYSNHITYCYLVMQWHVCVCSSMYMYINEWKGPRLVQQKGTETPRLNMHCFIWKKDQLKKNQSRCARSYQSTFPLGYSSNTTFLCLCCHMIAGFRQSHIVITQDFRRSKKAAYWLISLMLIIPQFRASACFSVHVAHILLVFVLTLTLMNILQLQILTNPLQSSLMSVTKLTFLKMYFRQ